VVVAGVAIAILCLAAAAPQSAAVPLLQYNTLVVLAGTTLLGAGAGIVGSFSVLRGRALLGDVLAHAALPGLCVAFLILRRRSLSVMLLGALISGLVSVLLMTFLRRNTRIKDDAAMGVVRSVMFGLGIVLISIVQNTVTEGSKAGLDSYIFGKTAGMLVSDVSIIAGVSAVALIVIVLLYKELRLTSFDPDFARVQGWPATLLDLLQMGLVAVMTVVGLPAVGAVLIAAMLILPGATMRFWTDRFSTLLLGSGLLGAAIGATGTLYSAQFSHYPAGPIIILSGTIFFLISMLCAPRRGLTARFVADRRFRYELKQRKFLAALYESGESHHDLLFSQASRVIFQTLGWSDRLGNEIIVEAERFGLIERRTDPTTREVLFRLTEEGRRHAARVVRGERLWSAYLDEFPEQTAAQVDLSAAELERFVPRDVLERLAAKLSAAGRLPPDGDFKLPSEERS
jgi:manganese/zinc/iron transport system permease protein